MFGKSAFGTGAPTTSFGFGASTASTPNPFGTGQLFGKPAGGFGSPSTSAFGQPATTSLFPSSQAQPNNLFQNAGTGFGTPASTPSTGFGTATPFGQQQQPATGGLFNTSSTFGQQNKPAAFGFGSQPAQLTLFGQQAAQPQTSGIFQPSTSNLFGTSSAFGQQATGTVGVKFNAVTGTDTMLINGVSNSINTKLHSITGMKDYESKYFEELRYEDYAANRKGPQQQSGFGATPFGNQVSSAPSLFGQPDASKPAFTGFGQSTTTFGQNTGFGMPTQQQQTGGLFGKPAADGESVRLLSESSNGKSEHLLNNTSIHPIEAFGSNNNTVNNESVVKTQLSEWLSNSDVLITSIDLPTENLSRLLCIRCHKVLSRFPVFCSAEGFSCGRCPYPKNCVRNDIYELLAQKLKFPCCYKERGCSENLFPKQVEQHESTCKFKKYLCPMNLTTACEWKGFSTELLEHYSQCHQMFIMQNAELFGVTFFFSKDENFLLSHKDNLYLINLAIDSQKNTFSCTVSYIRHDSDKGYNYYYKLIFENKNKPCYEIQNPINVTTLVKLEDLVQSNSINNCKMGFGKIEIFKGEEMSKKHRKEEESNTNLDYDILQELECMICCEYMLPPIYQCLTGHSICEECKESIKECPICRKEFQNTKNFALAQIIEHLNYPCKYNGCKFVTKSKDIRKHQTTCIYSPTNCQLKEHFDYYEETYVGEVYGHIVKNHDYILHINCSEKSSTPKSIVRSCFLVIYESKIFKLLSLYTNNKLCFTAQFMEPYYESSSYRFDIDILDKEKKSVLRRTNSCSRMTDSKTAFDDDMAVIMFTHNEIQNFIGDQIFFKVKIFKT